MSVLGRRRLQYVFAWSSHISIPNCSYLLWCTYCDDALPQDVESHHLLINSIGDTWCAVEFFFLPVSHTPAELEFSYFRCAVCDFES
jgi:hypothetical protein